jgi:hypothetical protein
MNFSDDRKMRMFNIKTLLLAVMAVGMFALRAQAQDPNVKLTTGVVAAQEGRWDEAMPALNIALKDPAGLKPANVPKAYYWRAKTRLGQFAAFQQNMGKTKDTTGLYKFENVLEDSYADYKKAKETDDGKWKDKINSDLNQMYGQLINMAGVMGLNVLYTEKNLTEQERIDGGKGVAEAMKMCTEIRPEEYLPLDLAGQAYLFAKDSAASLDAFNKGITLYEKTNSTNADIQAAYMYYRQCILERYYKKNLDNSLNSITKGKAVLEKEWAKMLPNKAKYTPEQWKAEEKKYEVTKGDLQRMEIDILMNFPDKLAETCKKIEAELEKNPKDYGMRVAYANMLEKLDVKKSIEQYEMAITADPTKEVAPFNLGALYNNLAKEKFDAGNAEADYSKAQALQKEGTEYLEKAKPAFEKALAANPKSLMAVRALKQVCITLNLTDDYNKYKEMEKQLTSGQ